MPEYVEIGHNCIASKYKSNGYGKLQLQEAINRISPNNVMKIIVTTNDNLIPAKRMYESVGFDNGILWRNGFAERNAITFKCVFRIIIQRYRCPASKFNATVYLLPSFLPLYCHIINTLQLLFSSALMLFLF